MRCRALLALATVLALAVPAIAQQEDVKIGQLAYLYDVDSSSRTYCRLVGQNQDVFASPIDGTANIKTTGSSTTVTAVSGTPFSKVGVGDVLISLQPDGVRETVLVSAWTSSTQVTVNTAVNWENGGSGYPFAWYDLQCGTGAENGWFSVVAGEHTSWLTVVQYEAGDLTGGLDVAWECRTAALGSNPVQVYPGGASDCGGFATLSTDVCQIATADVGTILGRLGYQLQPNNFSQCRVGLKGTDPGDPTTEQVTITVTSVR